LTDALWAVVFVALIVFGIGFTAGAFDEANGDWMAKVGGDGTGRGRPVQMWVLFGMGLLLTAMGGAATLSNVVVAVRALRERRRT
jgi:hypothetical protein